MNSNWFKLVMKMTKIEYGKNLLLKGVPIIFNKGGAKLKIGENTTIKSSFLSNLVGLYSRTIIVTRAPGAEIEIGDNVGISGATIYARKKITIGENTCIGGNCKILDNDFHPIETETRNKLLRDENGGDSDLVPSREIKIGKNCFIGCNSIILKGTVLGDGCVVGAGAVVCGKFEDNCVIAGNPARVMLNAYKNTYDSQGKYLEHVFYEALKKYKIKYKMFMERPLFLGISGSTGRKYEDIRKKHEIIIDFLCKTNIYNNEILWNIIASCKNKRVTDK